MTRMNRHSSPWTTGYGHRDVFTTGHRRRRPVPTSRTDDAYGRRRARRGRRRLRRLRRDDVVYTEHDDTRWLWVASVAGIVLLIASRARRRSCRRRQRPTPRSIRATQQGRAVSKHRTVPGASRPPSATALPPETITSVTPTPSRRAAECTTAQPASSRAAARGAAHGHLHRDREPASCSTW